MKASKWTLLNYFQILLWTGIACAILPFHSHFLYDEAYFYHQAISLAKTHAWNAYGPFISGSQPIALTPGGGLWQILSFPFLLSSDPRAGVVWVIVLSSLGIFLFDRSLRTFSTSGELRFFTIFFLTWSAWHNWLVDRIWNVDVYWGLSLILLAIVIQIIARSQGAQLQKKRFVSPWFFFLFGIISAWMTQIHLGGGLAVLVSMIMIWSFARDQIRLQPGLFYCSAVALMYCPYFYNELNTGFANTRALRSAHSFHGWNRQALVRSIFSPLIYVSYFRNPYQLMGAFKGDFLDWVAFLSSCLSILSGYYGLRQKHPLRFLFLLSWFVAPVYFLLTQRPFLDHYLASLVPYYLLVLGLGVTWLYQQGSWKRKLAWIQCILFISVGSLQSFGRLWVNSDHPTIGDQILLTQKLLESVGQGGPALAKEKDDAQAFISWVLAKDVFDKEIPFRTVGSNQVCAVEIGTQPIRNSFMLGPGTYLLCH